MSKVLQTPKMQRRESLLERLRIARIARWGVDSGRPIDTDIQLQRIASSTESLKKARAVLQQKRRLEKEEPGYGRRAVVQSDEQSAEGVQVVRELQAGMEGAKRAAAFAAGKHHIVSGCRLGVGSGSTVKYLVEFVSESVKSGALKDIICVPTSFLTRKWLVEAGLNVSNLEQTPELDVCIDGADEVDTHLNCIKGGGGCLTQEKIVQSSAKRFFVIADSRKQSKMLGEKWPCIPIEVVPLGYVPVMNWIKKQEGGECVLRMAEKKCGPVITDNNNYILDWNFPKGKFAATADLAELHRRLVTIPGVVETGLFVNVAEKVYFATPEGQVSEVTRP